MTYGCSTVGTTGGSRCQWGYPPDMLGLVKATGVTLIQGIPLLGDAYQAGVISSGYDPITGITLTDDERQLYAALHIDTLGIAPILPLFRAGNFADDAARAGTRIGAPMATRSTDLVVPITRLYDEIGAINAGFISNPSTITAVLSERQLRAVMANPRLRPSTYGNAVQEALRRRIEKSPELAAIVDFGPRPNRWDLDGLGPLAGMRFELTTDLTRTLRAHEARPYGGTLFYLMYSRPPSTFWDQVPYP